MKRLKLWKDIYVYFISLLYRYSTNFFHNREIFFIFVCTNIFWMSKILGYCEKKLSNCHGSLHLISKNVLRCDKTMTGISDEKLISQQVKAFLVAARKHAFYSELHLFDDEVTLKVPRLDGPLDSMHQFSAGLHFFSLLLFHYRRRRWSVNVADSKEHDDCVENNAIRHFVLLLVADTKKFFTIKKFFLSKSAWKTHRSKIISA